MRALSGDVDADMSAPSTLHGLALAQARRRPDAVAVRHAGRATTYRELEDRSAALARLLLDRGLGPGELVGVSMAPGDHMVVAVLAVLRAGAAYVAVDPAYPEERIRFILSDSGARTVLVDEASAWVPGLLGLEALRADRPAEPREPLPLPEVDPSRLPYLIYTSGSTGRPKGAMNRHAGVALTMRGLAEAIGLDHGDRVLQVSSLNFDLSVIEIFATFAAGGTVVVPLAAERTDPGALLDLLSAEAVTVWSSAPALLRPLTDTARRRSGALPEALRTVVLAGDRFPPVMAATLGELGPSVRAFNVAGMTEVSCCSTVYPVRKEDAERDAIPWGHTLPGHTAHVLGADGLPVPRGERGELYIGGAGVGQGYWRRPELTEERFVPDPFAEAPDATMYRTGDLAAVRPDGGIEFFGRLDGQVKIRGVRVETGELETALEQHPDIREAAVVARHDRVGEGFLVGYVVPEPGRLLTAAQCRDHLARTVPAHSLPGRFFFLSGIPLLPNGKADRAALPFPEDPASVADGEATAPDDLLVSAVIRVWEEVLGRQGVGAHDEFSEIGGQSLAAMEIVGRIREGWGAATGLAAFLDHSTPTRYAAHLRAAGAVAPEN
ncbi:non-ribosomal peptide synthetase [Streptomyces sp. S3(2020)]|uniref:non-ribosomal peptide synthetase n=1 Tax=Streptomyces sp. S3(2020) TaxID=2732044 RepID=UPI00148955F3|nr:non-ribosomal peptide synthetase [Streptomyces sp. S3(2020)]NNN29665.1 non-ribosomal peptide synthetase [Streptomyces sp. S3(2020)]